MTDKTWEQTVENTVATLTPVIQKMIEVQDELAKEPGCNGWHSGIQMYYARNHYGREGKDAKHIVICPIHGSLG